MSFTILVVSSIEGFLMERKSRSWCSIVVIGGRIEDEAAAVEAI